jgi:hypothetical protein
MSDVKYRPMWRLCHRFMSVNVGLPEAGMEKRQNQMGHSSAGAVS